MKVIVFIYVIVFGVILGLVLDNVQLTTPLQMITSTIYLSLTAYLTMLLLKGEIK